MATRVYTYPVIVGDYVLVAYNTLGVEDRYELGRVSSLRPDDSDIVIVSMLEGGYTNGFHRRRLTVLTEDEAMLWRLSQ